jgi:hypothetical protein
MSEKSQTQSDEKIQQKEAVDKVLKKLTKKDPSTYYLSAIQIAELVKSAIDGEKDLDIDAETRGKLKGLSKWDIQMLMSFHPQ